MIWELHDVSFAYPGRIPCLHRLSWTIPAARFTAVIGVNGCGKSTLLKLLAHILAPDQGFLSADGRKYRNWDRRLLARKIAWMAQSQTFPEMLSVAELAACGRYPFDLSDPRNRPAIRRALEISGAAAFAERRVGELSGGEKQRAMLAFALAREPELLLLDEPSAALDPAAEREIFARLAEWQHDNNATIIVVLHDLNRALRCADYLLALEQGRVRFCLPPAEAAAELPALFHLPPDSLQTAPDGKPCIL